MYSSVQRWLTGYDSLSAIKGRDLGNRRFRGKYEHNRLGVTRLRILSFRCDKLDITAKK